ncbi:MAG: PfkB family carbohydrate kinase [Paracoccaceae bacterium]
MRPAPDILCIGSALWDTIGRAKIAVRPGMDIPGRIRRQPGGVALNIAITLARLGMRPALLTSVGRDAEGDALVAEAARLGLDTASVFRDATRPTDRYMAVEGTNGLIAAIADAHTLEAAGEAILAPLADGRLGSAAAPWRGPVVLDGNLTAALLAVIAASPLFAAADLRIAPASPGKAARLAPLLGHPRATLYVNLEEASILAGASFSGAEDAARGLVAAGATRALVTDGARAAADAGAAGTIAALPPRVPETRVTGAGDTFMAAHIVAEARGARRSAALRDALAAAAAFVAGS